MRGLDKGPAIGQRHVLIVLASVGLFLLYSMQMSLSVALVAMVNKTDTETNNASINDECPIVATNSSNHATTYNGEFNWSRKVQGYILSAFFWGAIILQIPAGTFAQKYGAKWFFGIGILWVSVLTLLSPLIVRFNVYLFLVIRFLEGLGQGLILPSQMAMIGRWTPWEETSLLISITATGTAAGAIVGQMAAGPLCVSSFLGGWPSVFYIFGGLGVLWFILWCFLAYDSPEKHPRISIEEKNYIMRSIVSQEEANKKAIPWKRILLSVPFWSCVVAQTVSSWMVYTIMTCLPQFLSDVLHFDIGANGLVSSAPYISMAIFFNVFSKLSDTSVSRGWFGKTVTKKFFSFISLVGCGACLFGVTFVSCSKAWVIVILILSLTLYSAMNGGYGSVLLDLSPEYCGTISAISVIIANLTGIATPLLTDYITADKTIHEWNIVFYISSGACAFGIVQFLMFGSAEHQNWGADIEDNPDDVSERCEDTEPIVVNF